MTLNIRRAAKADIPECGRCLDDSQLRDEYFSEPGYIESFLKDALHRNELIVASSDNEIAGFIRVDPVGAFSRFPLLRLIAVRPDRRGQGVGSLLLRHYEEDLLAQSGKLFLLVSDFNENAKRLYEKFDYQVAGKIPDLYKSGVTELLMMKTN